MNEKLKKISNKFITMSIIAIIILIVLFFSIKKYQIMDNLDYDVVLNEDGSALITETWDIKIKNTNTLFKTFHLSPSKYGNITNVSIKDLESDTYLTKIDKPMYHVTKDCYYAIKELTHQFEVAWGIGMDHDIGTRKYQLQYTIEDAITSYNDMQEFYWQFVEEGQNKIPVKNITGRIKLPKEVNKIENLKVWGHGPLNGEIKPISKNEVEFKIKNLKPNNMLEIRVVNTDKMFNSSENKIRKYNYLETLLKQEKNWANKANTKRDSNKIFFTVILSIYGIIIIFNGIKIKKYLDEKKKTTPKVQKLEYFRDIPRKGFSTPAEAIYLYKFNKERLSTDTIQSKSVAATILDLCLKKAISLRVNNDKVYVKILENNENLKEDEKQIYKLLQEVGKDKEEFEIEELKTFANSKYYRYSSYIDKFVNSARNNLYKEKLIDKAKEQEYNKFTNAEIKEVILRNIYEFMFVFLIYSILPLFNIKLIFTFGFEYARGLFKFLVYITPYVLLKLQVWKLQDEIKENILVLTEKGAEEKEQWKGLKKYMLNFSLLNEKEVPDLILWEEYLVYATAFGISKKVIEQMKALYPEVFVEERWDSNNNELYPLMDLITINNIHINPFDRIDSISNKSYSDSLYQISVHSSSSSSGSGSGGGFSSGGGGRRRRRPEWVEDKKLYAILMSI